MNLPATNYVMVYVTTSSRAEAETIARALLENRLAACVNILGEVSSHYRWKGKVESSNEMAMVIKTRQSLFDKVRATIKLHHSYDVPCIVAYPMADGDAHYLKWISAETLDS